MLMPSSDTYRISIRGALQAAEISTIVGLMTDPFKHVKIGALRLLPKVIELGNHAVSNWLFTTPTIFQTPLLIYPWIYIQSSSSYYRMTTRCALLHWRQFRRLFYTVTLGPRWGSVTEEPLRCQFPSGPTSTDPTAQIRRLGPQKVHRHPLYRISLH
jgi:hypothetical protein